MLLVSEQGGAWFAPNVPLGQKSFWMHLKVLQGDEAQVETCFGPFGEPSGVAKMISTFGANCAPILH
jgi:hypothetical protein